METAAGRRRGIRKPTAAGAERKIERLHEREADTGSRAQVSARRRQDWKPHPGSIYFVVEEDGTETGPTSPVPARGNAPEGELP